MAQRPAIAARGQQRVHGIAAPDSAKRGIYVSEYAGSGSIIYGYPKNNRANKAPVCSLDVSFGSGVNVDRKGNLIVSQSSNAVTVFSGRGMCGSELGSVQLCCDGIAISASSTDAASGTIAVAALQNGSGYGSIQLCKVGQGVCKTNLTNQYLNFVYGVAVAKNGDCWAASYEPTALVYFKGCAGSGQEATGYLNAYSGALGIDKGGNLISIDESAPALYVYSGCNPACKLVGGPSPLLGQGAFGSLNKNSTTLAIADSQYDQVDIYKYTPTSLSYEYSFNNGLSPDFVLVSAAYNPGR